MTKSAIIFGASGLVGDALVEVLAKSSDYHPVKRVLRRSLIPVEGVEDLIVQDLFDTQMYQSHLKVDVVFCCLGTTRKKAGSKKNFVSSILPCRLRLPKHLRWRIPMATL